MLIYRIIFSLLLYIFYGRGLKRRARCRQTKNRQRAGGTNSGADYIPVLTPDAASRPLGLDRSSYGLATSVSTQLWAWSSNLCIEPFKSCYTKFERNFKKYANLWKLGKQLMLILK